MRRIDCFLTPVSPWMYLCGTRHVEIAARHDCTIHYKPCDPTALFARTGGLPLGQRHESRQAYRMQELRRWPKQLGMPLNARPAHFPVNPAPASYAIIAAQSRLASGAASGDIHALVQGLGRACWADERDISDDAVIGDCLAAAGFDRGLTMSGLLEGAETYGRNLADAIEVGVFGYPFFVVEDEKFWGQDRLAQLEMHLAGQL
jgi:2-hydroxychromene-2-carboxylate isomerase